MTPSKEPESAKKDEDLPATKFDNKFRKCAKIDILENAVFSNENIDFYKDSKNFMSNFSRCYTQQTIPSDPKLYGKRCRDLNYYADYSIDLISELQFKGRKGKKVKLSKNEIDNVKKYMKLLFEHSGKLKCNREEEDYINRIPIKKDLDDFCENRDYLNGYLNDSNKDCDRLTTYVKEKYDFFFNENTCILDPNNGNEKPLEIDNTCTLYNIPATFSNFRCKEFKIPNIIQSIPHCPKTNTSFFDQPLEHVYEYVDYMHDLTSIPKDVIYIVSSALSVSILSFISFILYKIISISRNSYKKKTKRRIENDMDYQNMQFFPNPYFNEPLHSPNVAYNNSFFQGHIC